MNMDIHGSKKTMNDLYGNERAIKLHTNNCDKLYRWSMWRMHLNEELSRAISAKRDFNDQSNALHKVTSPYTDHPDGRKYGRQMKKLFKTSISGSNNRGLDTLSDNSYLVFGLPRVSLSRKVPESVRQLHESVCDSHFTRSEIEDRTQDKLQTADEEISDIFKFINLDSTKSESQVSSQQLKEHVCKERKDILGANKRNLDSDSGNAYNINANIKHMEHTMSIDTDGNTVSEIKTPLVSKSRLFWEKLSKKKNEIVQLEKTTTNNCDSEPVSISSEILQRQQRLLKKPMQKRTSKDLWQTLRERKTEILQMSEMADAKLKKEPSKTSQLWSFIFHRKKDLIQMKRGIKPNQEHGRHHVEQKRATGNIETLTPRNFEDSFQKELAERLNSRRYQGEVITTS